MILIHVLTALLLLGPVTVAASAFPKYARGAAEGDVHALGAARALNKVTATYSLFSLAVPLVGFGVMFMDSDTSEYLRSGWVHISLLLSVIAWALLFFLVLPSQNRMIDALGGDGAIEPATDPDPEAVAALDWKKESARVAAGVGVFAILWVVIAALMILKPMNKEPTENAAPVPAAASAAVAGVR